MTSELCLYELIVQVTCFGIGSKRKGEKDKIVQYETKAKMRFSISTRVGEKIAIGFLYKQHLADFSFYNIL